MPNCTPEQQKKFDDIIKEIKTALDPTKCSHIIEAMEDFWKEINSTDSPQQ